MEILIVILGVLVNIGLTLYLLFSLRTLKDERAVISEIKQDFAEQRAILSNLLQTSLQIRPNGLHDLREICARR